MIFILPYPLYRDYRRYAAILGMIRYTLNLVQMRSRIDLIKNQFKTLSMTVQCKCPCKHSADTYEKTQEEKIRIKIK